MPLASGTRLGPYEIIAPIGTGGMGEVYKATDTRLNRAVAIKVLPRHVAADPDLKQRLEREARTLAALSHPHICSVFDVGSQNAIDFLVMEYLVGDTLEQRLKKGALPLDQALQIGIQIADALTAAHRAGINHRDLKPGNIMLTTSGAKLLDFGLAKISAPPVAGNLSMLPTTPPNLTAQGAILGTLQYMAPEQLEGREADARTDIFAFGAVAYEMVTGRTAFEGKSQASLIGAILKDEPPPMSSLQPLAPPALDRIVKKCLAKEPDRRWQSSSDLTDELRWLAAIDSQAPSMASLTPSLVGAVRQRWLTVGLVAVLSGAAVAGLIVWNVKPAPLSAPQPVMRFAITLPRGDRLPELFEGPQGAPVIAVSPDGRHFAYVAVRGNQRLVFVRAIDGDEARPVAGTDGASALFSFSPDGQWIAYGVSGDLRKIPIGGGTPLSLGIGGGAWNESGTMVRTGPQGIELLSDSGGPPTPLIRPEHPQTGYVDVLPGGRGMLVTEGLATSGHISVYSLVTGERRALIDNATYPRYAASGHLLYAQNGALFAVPFSVERLAIHGTALPVVESIVQSLSGAAQYAVSATGSLIYLSEAVTQKRRLVWVARDGTETPLAAPLRGYDWPRLSPDGRRIAVEVGAQTWIYDIDRDTLTRFTFEGTQNDSPTWTPDGRRLAFRSNRNGPLNIYWQMADGSGGSERLTTSDRNQIPSGWSSDGQLLAFHQVAPMTIRDIWMFRLSSRTQEPFLQTTAIEGAPRLSPNGRWLVYVSNESGQPEVYVQPYPGPGGKWQISTDGGMEAAWNPNGREVFYRSGNKMMVVPVTTDAAFTVGKPMMLFEAEYVSSQFPLTSISYDVSADSGRFLMIKPEPTDAGTTQINVVLNFFEELKRRVPTN